MYILVCYTEHVKLCLIVSVYIRCNHNGQVDVYDGKWIADNSKERVGTGHFYYYLKRWKTDNGSLFHFRFFIEQSTFGKRHNNPFLFSQGKLRNRITSRYSIFVFQFKKKETDNESLFHFRFPICIGKTIGRIVHGPSSLSISMYSRVRRGA